MTAAEIIFGKGLLPKFLGKRFIFLAVLMENKRRAKDMEDNNAKSDLDEETDLDDISETDFNDEE